MQVAGVLSGQLSWPQSLGAGDDAGEHAPAEAEAAGRTREASDHPSALADLVASGLQEIGAVRPASQPVGVAHGRFEHWQGVGRAGGGAEKGTLQIGNHSPQPGLGIALAPSLVEGCPVGFAHPRVREGALGSLARMLRNRGGAQRW